MLKFLKGCVLTILCVIANQAFTQPSVYFLPANYDGSSGLADIANVGNFTPICSGSTPLRGLDLVRAYVGTSTCSVTNASERLHRIPDFVLLVDDTVPMSSYLVDMLRVQDALARVNDRTVVSSKVMEFSLGGNTIRILLAGEQAYRNLGVERWFALIDSAPSSLVGSGSTSSSGVINRVSWNTFRSSPQYNQLLSAIRTMQANTDSNDSSSWLYWSNIHRDNCPHSVAYFLAWHRGYLYHFERKIQELSGNSSFRLPYWDYYADPNMPTEFTSNTANNPLYVAGRTNTNVRAALSLHSFENRYVNFPTGAANAFEPEIERLPHNQVHNIIGAPWMLDLDSPRDPIFWVHHANIDRLWSAWVAAGNGRNMPSSSDSYWVGNLPDGRTSSGPNFKYGNTLTLERLKTISSRQYLAYDYDNTNLPATVPPAAPARPTRRPSGASLTSGSDESAIVLDEQSVTLPVSVPTSVVSTFNSMQSSGQALSSLKLALVLANVQLTEAGRRGGYGYSIYLNLPARESSGAPMNHHFVGTVGPFEINGLAHDHGGGTHHQSDLTISIPASVLEEAIRDSAEMEFSFIRVNGENSPRGQVITIRAVRIINQSVSSDFPNS